MSSPWLGGPGRAAPVEETPGEEPWTRRPQASRPRASSPRLGGPRRAALCVEALGAGGRSRCLGFWVSHPSVLTWEFLS